MSPVNDAEYIAKRRLKILLSIIALMVLGAIFSGNIEQPDETSADREMTQRDKLLQQFDDLDAEDEQQRVEILIAVAATDSATDDDTATAAEAIQTYVTQEEWPELDEKLALLNKAHAALTSEWLDAEIEKTKFFKRVESDCRSAVRDDILSSIRNPSTYEYNYGYRFWANDIYAIVTEFSAQNAFGLRQEFISRHACEPEPEKETYTFTRVSVVQEPHRF